MIKTTTPKSPLLIASIQLGLLLFILYYTFIGGQTAQGIYDHSWRLITVWVTSLLAGCWLLWRIFGRYKTPHTPLDWPLLFLLASWSLATFFSINPLYSRETIVFYISYLTFFYMMVDLGRWPWFRELTFNAIIAVSGLIWMLALLQLSRWYADYVTIINLLPVHIRPEITLPRLSVLGNPNTMASYIALVIPLILYKLAVVQKSITRSLLGIWLILLSGALLLTQSRGGWLALVIAVGVYIALSVLPGAYSQNPDHKDRLNPLNLKRAKWALLLILLLLGLFAWLTFSQRSLSAGVDIRQQVMVGALKSWRQHPIFGTGPGTLGEALIRYQQPLGIIWADAHNMYLTLIAETGLIGAVGLIWLGIVCFKLLLQQLRQSPLAGGRNLSGTACIAALLGFMAHGLVDSQLKFPLIMLHVAVLAGFWVSSYISVRKIEQTSKEKSWSSLVSAGILVIVVVNAVLSIRSIENIAVYNQAVEAAGRNDWQAAVTHLQDAYQLVPAGPFYKRQLGFTAGYLANHKPGYRKQAIAHYRAALETIDQLPLDHANLGCLLWADGQQEEAIREFTLVQDMESDNMLYRLNLAYYLEMAGDDQAARQAYIDIITTWPDIIEASYWQENDQRSAAIAAAIETTRQAPPAHKEQNLLKTIDLYLNSQNVDEARQLLDTQLAQGSLDTVTERLSQGKISFALGDFEEARLNFEAALQENSKLAEVHLYLSQIELAENNLAEASHYIERILFNQQTPTALYQSARVLEAKGDSAGAIKRYEAAFVQATTIDQTEQTRYATEVARRRPLPVSYLPCLVRIYPSNLLVKITQAQGDLLERQGHYEAAARVYRRLLGVEPSVESITARLATLCQDDHPRICGN